MSAVENTSPYLTQPINSQGGTRPNHQAKSSVSSISSTSSPQASRRNLPSPSPRFSTVELPETKAHRHTQSLLSPQKPFSRDRSSSRPSSRNSIKRSHSPSVSLDDPVAIRNHMSTLKHSIRHQQAQLNNLESIVRVGPRPYAPELLSELNDDVSMSSTSPSSNPYINSAYDTLNGVNGNGPAPPSSFRDVGEGSSTATPAIKIKRRSSYDVLQGIAGPDSNLPLPRRLEGTVSASDADADVIREGIPTSVSPSSPPLGHYKRRSSPTRTLSRIPISAVGNARALADEGLVARSPSNLSKLYPTDNSTDASSSTLPSPNKRLSFTPGNTTRVLADLQTGVVNARNALEHTKSQLRLSQRTVSQLTRQTEDLKESRERLRLENEGLNNVVARKERLLQEVLERARKAEAEATTLKQQLKTETSSTKKALREMETALTESTALSSKSEREYITLRDSMKGLIEAWKHDTDRLRDEMNKRDAKSKSEAEKLGLKYKKLLEEVKNAEAGRKEIEKLKVETKEKDSEVEAFWTSQIEKMKAEVEESNQKAEGAEKTAKNLQELTRLRRLMREAGRVSGSEAADSGNTPDA